jgi:hypothetical protein
MKRSLPRIAFLLCLYLYANATNAKSLPLQQHSKTTVDTTGGWILQAESNGVKAYYQVVKCADTSAVLMKLVNANPYAVTVIWDDYIKTTSDTYPVQLNPTTSALELAADETLVGNCSDAPEKKLVSKLRNAVDAVIQSFSFLNFRTVR